MLLKVGAKKCCSPDATMISFYLRSSQPTMKNEGKQNQLKCQKQHKRGNYDLEKFPPLFIEEYVIYDAPELMLIAFRTQWKNKQ